MAFMRYRCFPIFISLVALLVGILVALLMTTASSAASGSGTSKRSGHAVGGATILIRPVQCYASPYVPSQSANGPLPTCGDPYLLTTAAIDVSPGGSVQGYASNNLAPDPAFAGYPNTAHDTPIQSVLLGDLRGQSASAERYLLGPSEMRLVAANVESTSVQKTRYGQLIVKIQLTPTGAAIWDRVAEENFHQFIAIDMGGKVVSAPIIEPTQRSFSSFHGVMEISGDINSATARTVAAAAR
jgi:hypothetical protein